MLLKFKDALWRYAMTWRQILGLHFFDYVDWETGMTLIREETKPVSISQQFSVSPMVIYTHSFKKVSEIKNNFDTVWLQDGGDE